MFGHVGILVSVKHGPANQDAQRDFWTLFVLSSPSSTHHPQTCQKSKSLTHHLPCCCDAPEHWWHTQWRFSQCFIWNSSVENAVSLFVLLLKKFVMEMEKWMPCNRWCYFFMKHNLLSQRTKHGGFSSRSRRSSPHFSSQATVRPSLQQHIAPKGKMMIVYLMYSINCTMSGTRK